MPVSERTYSFRAPDDLGDRIREVSAFLDEVADENDPEVAARIARELTLAILRDHAKFRGIKDNQSAFVRETVELVVDAAQKVASDLHYEAVYAAAADLRSEEEQDFRLGARQSAARRWRDE